MKNITRSEVLMVGGIELTHEAEQHVYLDSTTKLLSVACGTGELELYLVRKYNCETIGVDKTVKFIKRANEKLESSALDFNISHRLTGINNDRKRWNRTTPLRDTRSRSFKDPCRTPLHYAVRRPGCRGNQSRAS